MWHLDVHQRLQVKNQVAWALIFGETVHTALEYYYKYERKLTDMLSGFEAAWKKENDLLKKNYGSMYDLGIGEEWWSYHDKGKEMLTHYDTYDKQENWFRNIIAVNIEERAFVDVLGPHEQKLPGRPYLLSGRIDLVVERKDGIWIWDHKTAASPPSLRALDVDDQLTGYCYIYWRLTGERPRGAIYNVLLKEPPKPPRVLKDGSLSKDKSQRTTYDLYLQTIQELGLEESDYDEFLSMLKDKGWGQFFIRDGSERNEQELQSFGRRLYREFVDMELCLEHPELLYPNPNQWNCGYCPYIAICQAMEEQGDWEYVAETGYEVVPPRHKVPAAVQKPKWKGV